MTKLSFKRGITDYAKVQMVIGSIARGKDMFIRHKRIKGLEYLDIGCGPNSSADFVNLDYAWKPQIDVCWDLTVNRLPFSDNSFSGIYSEHCFEHIPFESFQKNMKEIYRILKPNGIFRLIMPDGELYLDIYAKRKNGSDEQMPYEEGYISPMHRINGIFRNHGHQCIYDFEMINIILKDAGFNSIGREKFNEGKDKNLLRDNAWREDESIYVEAIK